VVRNYWVKKLHLHGLSHGTRATEKDVGDEAIVKTASGQFVWRITQIEYQK